jgi:NADP-dependent 3-hydroxy acid dehydrogenase YdfG
MIYTTYTQFFPPKPTFTEENLPSQKGKVFIVTGGNSGIGYELCKILYGSGATIYMVTRSEVSSPKLRSPFSTND